MKFFAGFLTSTLLFLLLIIGAWLYFDLPIDTNNETYTETQTYQTEPSQAPISENNVDNTEITPSGLTVDEYEELEHNEAGTNNHDYAKSHEMIKEDK